MSLRMLIIDAPYTVYTNPTTPPTTKPLTTRFFAFHTLSLAARFIFIDDANTKLLCLVCIKNIPL